MNRYVKFKNIVLIGMSGAGKTTVGKYIASKLNMEFVNTDDIIVLNFGDTIEQIFSKYGEEYFRNLEKKVIEGLKEKENIVISTGGGVVIDEVNIDILKKNGIFVYLEASIDTLVRNVKSSKENRPLLDNDNLYSNIEEIYNKRKRLYISSADYIVQVDNKSIESIGDEVIYILDN